jgi:hypothetical protein
MRTRLLLIVQVTKSVEPQKQVVTALSNQHFRQVTVEK